MIQIKNKEKCCGCAACSAICPLQCISMEPDEQGFLYPEIDREHCILCGKCERVCPTRHSGEIEEFSVSAYIARNKNETIREGSSSGGIFSLFAEWILEAGGTVYGASYDENFEVCHVSVNDKEQMDHLRGSKYVQSRMSNVYSKIRDELNQGKKVLFSGTACQVSGLKNYMGKEYDNLYTVDILCHGVPSIKVWKRYLYELSGGEEKSICTVNMRSKSTGWKSYSVKIEFKDGEVYECLNGKDTFMRLFLSDICLRDSCYDCQFKSLDRSSDVTIGDAWGVGKQFPEMDDDKGTSLVILRNEKGKLMVEKIFDKLEIKACEIDEVLPKKNPARSAVKPHRNRAKFWKEFLRGCSLSRLEKLSKDYPWKRAYYKMKNHIFK